MKYLAALLIVLSSIVLAGAGPAFNGSSSCFTGNGYGNANCFRPTPTPPASTVPVYNGCQVFSNTDPTFNTNVSAVAADPNSANYMTAMLSVGTNWFLFGNHSAAFWDINKATGSTYAGPLVETDLATLEFGITSFPFLATYQWQGQGGVGDHHLMVIRNSDCTVSESYSNTNEGVTGASWKPTTAPAPVSGTTAVVEDVTNRKIAAQCLIGNHPFPTPVPTGTVTQTVKCSISHGPTLGGQVFPYLIRWEDVCTDGSNPCDTGYANTTPHALGIDGPLGFTLNHTWVYPAAADCGVCGTTAGTPPLGAHVVLLPAATASVSCYNATPALSTCPQASFIINCLLQYGAYFTDQTTATNTGFTFRMGNDTNGNDPWSSTDVNNINSIAVNSTNFKFIPPPYSSTTIANCLGNFNPNGC